MSNVNTVLLPPVTIETAPEGSRPLLEQVKKGFGYVPNLMGAFANSPTVLEGYLSLSAVFEKGTFTPVERQLILLAASVVNECGYCTAAHSTVAKAMLHVPAPIVSAVRANQPVPDKKISALVALTKEVVTNRGHVSDSAVRTFLNAGYQKDQVGELLVGVALKTISNYFDHISPSELDAGFQAER